MPPIFRSNFYSALRLYFFSLSTPLNVYKSSGFLFRMCLSPAIYNQLWLVNFWHTIIASTYYNQLHCLYLCSKTVQGNTTWKIILFELSVKSWHTFLQKLHNTLLFESRVKSKPCNFQASFGSALFICTLAQLVGFLLAYTSPAMLTSPEFFQLD